MQATRHRIGGARRLQAGVCAHIQRHKYFCTVWATLRIKAHLRRARCRAAAPAIAMSVLRPASLLLQAYVHRALTRRRHHAKRHACSCLQAVQQGRLQQRRGAVYLERAVAARCLQACFRRLLCRRAPRMRFSAILLQAHARRLLSITSLAGRSVGGVTVSKFARAALGRCQHSQTVAGVLLQAYARTLAARLKWRTVDGAAICKTPVQFDERDRQERELLQHALTSIQANFRRLLALQAGVLETIVARKKGAVCLLQALTRRQQMQRQFSELLAGLTLQAACQTMLLTRARGRASTSAAVVAASCRRILARQVHHQGAASLTTIQAAVRRRVQVGTRQGQEMARRRLKSAARRALAGLEQGRQLNACLQMQAACLCAMARRAHQKDIASRSLQAALRRDLLRQPRALGLTGARAHIWDQVWLRHFGDNCCRMHDMRQAGSTLGRTTKRALLRQTLCKKRIAALTCQAALRRLVMKAEGMKQLDVLSRTAMTQAKERLHRVFKMTLARERYQKHAVARTMQAAARRSVVSSAVVRHLDQIDKISGARVLTRFMLSTASCQRHAHTRRAVKILQAALRHRLCHNIGHAQMHSIRTASAALVFWGFVHARGARERFRKFRFVGKTLASVCKRALSRTHYCKGQAAKMLAACIRRRLDAHHRTQQAVARQRLGKYISAALIALAHTRERIASVTLQASIKACLSLKSHLTRRRAARAVLGPLFRGALRRRLHARHLSAAVTLQATTRRAEAQTRGQALVNAVRLDDAVPRLQSIIRRKLLRGARQGNDAARMLHAALRRKRDADRYRHVLQVLRETLQRVARAGLFRQHHTDRITATIRIQAVVRARMGIASLSSTANAALALQAASRRSQAQIQYGLQRRASASGTLLPGLMRALAQSRYCQTLSAFHVSSAAGTLQALLRRSLSQSVYHEAFASILRGRAASTAGTLQALVRRSLSQRIYLEALVAAAALAGALRGHAASELQARSRRLAGRNRYTRALAAIGRANATVVLQGALRRSGARTLFRQELTAIATAAIKLQSASKRSQARRWYGIDLERKVSAAATLQVVVKRRGVHSRYTDELDAFHRSTAALTLQTRMRRSWALKNYSLQLHRARQAARVQLALARRCVCVCVCVRESAGVCVVMRARTSLCVSAHICTRTDQDGGQQHAQVCSAATLGATLLSRSSSRPGPSPGCGGAAAADRGEDEKESRRCSCKTASKAEATLGTGLVLPGVGLLLCGPGGCCASGGCASSSA